MTVSEIKYVRSVKKFFQFAYNNHPRHHTPHHAGPRNPPRLMEFVGGGAVLARAARKAAGGAKILLGKKASLR